MDVFVLIGFLKGAVKLNPSKINHYGREAIAEWSGETMTGLLLCKSVLDWN